MKTAKLVIATVVTAASQLIGAQSGNAQQFFPASLELSSVATNAAGNLAEQRLSNKSIISIFAAEQGITNVTGLSLVYDAKADAVEVVSGTNDTLIATALTFAESVDLNNTNGTALQRFAWVYWGSSTTPNGSLVAGEQIIPAITTKPAHFSLQGQLQFGVPASSTLAPAIYAGNLSAEALEVHTGTNSIHEVSETNEVNEVSKTNSVSKSRH